MPHALITLEEKDVASLVDKIGEACDGQSLALILVAFGDMLAAMGDIHPAINLDEVMADFLNLMNQRHGVGSIRSIN